MSKNMNGGRKGIPDEYRKDFTEMEYGEIVAWFEDRPVVDAVKHGLKVLMRTTGAHRKSPTTSGIPTTVRPA